MHKDPQAQPYQLSVVYPGSTVLHRWNGPKIEKHITLYFTRTVNQIQKTSVNNSITSIPKKEEYIEQCIYYILVSSHNPILVPIFMVFVSEEQLIFIY